MCLLNFDNLTIQLVTFSESEYSLFTITWIEWILSCGDFHHFFLLSLSSQFSAWDICQTSIYFIRITEKLGTYKIVSKSKNSIKTCGKRKKEKEDLPWFKTCMISGVYENFTNLTKLVKKEIISLLNYLG